jgi:hypothetical protein
MGINDDDNDGVDAVVGDGYDAQASKDPSPFSSCVVVMVEIFTAATMEELERQGSAVTA